MQILSWPKIFTALLLVGCCSMGSASVTTSQRLHEFIAKTDTIATNGKSTAERAKLVNAEYIKDFDTDAAAIPDDELADFFEATQYMMFYTLDKSKLPFLEKMFDGLISIRKATSEQSMKMLQMYYSLREFKKANSLLERYGRNYSQRHTMKINDLASPSAPRTGWVLKGRRSLTRLDLDLKTGQHLVIVLSPYCPFAIKAVSEIEGNSTLVPLLRRRVTVMAMQDFNFNYNKYANWNQMHPLLPLVLAHSREEWPEVFQWVSPLFLFFRDGKLESTFSGWPPEGNWDKLYEGLGITVLPHGVAPSRPPTDMSTLPTARYTRQDAPSTPSRHRPSQR
ncbi:hypothetical protein [Massilia genomosp. 1]|uniref:Thioredoxin domain-containing protein n=1 Tax=Massilia genomosp. 1 TaxID=2609280 RepID=A0ABX0MRN7_9BURK|nr:hypothetical protein [Massilia genomosp. 1]NHZ63021.1 hypothetical protein [Massilia genomosp. 1]